MIRGSYLSQNELQGQQIFPLELINKQEIKDGYLRKFISDNFSEYHVIDKRTGYIIQGTHDIAPTIHRYRLKVYMITEVLYYDQLFISKDKFLFRNSETGDSRRINPEKIQMILLEELQRITIYK